MRAKRRSHRHGPLTRIGKLVGCLLALVWPAPSNGQRTLIADVQSRLSIGSEDGEEPYRLAGVSAAIQAADGTIIVANCGTSELRFFDTSGRHIRSVGRAGEGPGEFRYLRRIFMAGDSIVAFDGFPASRVSVFTAQGKFVRSIQVFARADVIARLSDGTFLGRASQAPAAEMGIARAKLTLYRLGEDGELLDSLSGLHGIETGATPRGRRLVRMGRTSNVAVVAGRIVVADQANPYYSEYDAKLKPVRRVRTITQPQPWTNELKKKWEASRQVMIPQGGVIGAFGPDYGPELPSFRDVVAGTDHRLWIQDPDRPGIYPLTWTAYEDDRASARAQLPARFFPTQFGLDWVLGIFSDSLGVEHVQKFTLRSASHSEIALPPRVAQPPDQPRCGAWASR